MNERCVLLKLVDSFFGCCSPDADCSYIQSVHLVPRHSGLQAPFQPRSTTPQSCPPSASRACPIFPVALLSAVCSSLSLTHVTHICPVEDIAHDTRHGDRIHEGEIRRPRRPAEVPPPVLVECYKVSVSLVHPMSNLPRRGQAPYRSIARAQDRCGGRSSRPRVWRGWAASWAFMRLAARYTGSPRVGVLVELRFD